jgi:hypothetical protein
MIRFSLSCKDDHTFEAWFRNSEDFENQKKRKLVTCPQCGSHEVEKALMAPAISRGKSTRMTLAANEQQRRAMAQLRSLVEKIRANAEYVGDRFAEEARRIHFGEVEPRGIYGEATTEEARSLAEDGVDFLPLPVFPEDRN